MSVREASAGFRVARKNSILARDKFVTSAVALDAHHGLPMLIARSGSQNRKFPDGRHFVKGSIDQRAVTALLCKSL